MDDEKAEELKEELKEEHRNGEHQEDKLFQKGGGHGDEVFCPLCEFW